MVISHLSLHTACSPCNIDGTWRLICVAAESRKRAAEAEPETTTRIKVARTEPPPRQIYPEPSFDTVRHDIAMKSKSMVWEAGELLISLPEHPAIEPSPGGPPPISLAHSV